MKTRTRNGSIELRDPSSPLMRAFLRTPVAFYRTPLRALLGSFYIQIEHRGRKSGRIYRTVVDRLHTDKESGEVFVTSAWGEKSDWYRNIKAASPSSVWVGRQRFEPIQRIVDFEEAHEIHRRAKEERPLAMRFGLALIGYPFPKSDEELRELSRFMPIVGFRRGPSPSGGRDSYRRGRDFPDAHRRRPRYTRQSFLTNLGWSLEEVSPADEFHR